MITVTVDGVQLTEAQIDEAKRKIEEAKKDLRFPFGHRHCGLGANLYAEKSGPRDVLLRVYPMIDVDEVEATEFNRDTLTNMIDRLTIIRDSMSM